ncbi:unnamed protein product [Caenorhabditis auriculariae]|uniref:Lipoprotein n=1 Tax=Caenorhabditis auriculariae TaxID=2777116 RepID=A0A8S1H5M5_9PELO|nr:unnamed protein product [Caenorhabditis auriculariae]
MSFFVLQMILMFILNAYLAVGCKSHSGDKKNKNIRSSMSKETIKSDSRKKGDKQTKNKLNSKETVAKKADDKKSPKSPKEDEMNEDGHEALSVGPSINTLFNQGVASVTERVI